MSATSQIEWTDATWNPTRGCARVSPGCKHCYAERFAARFAGDGMPYNGLVKLGSRVVKREFANGDVELKKVALEARWTGAARFVPEMLDQPIRWKKPRRIFVNSMSDLFHEDVTDDDIAAVFGVMAACSQHTFQILTKRAERMHAWFSKLNVAAVIDRNANLADDALLPFMSRAQRAALLAPGRGLQTWPLSNVWLGVSVEDQTRLAERVPLLLSTPAALRFVSAEPLLGKLDFDVDCEAHESIEGLYRVNFLNGRNRDMGRPCRNVSRLDWVIVGGESGSGSRPFHLEWARSIVTQCREARAHVFVKQMGDAPHLDGKPLKLSRKGKDMAEWPEDLRVREMP